MWWHFIMVAFLSEDGGDDGDEPREMGHGGKPRNRAFQCAI